MVRDLRFNVGWMPDAIFLYYGPGFHSETHMTSYWNERKIHQWQSWGR